MICPFCQATLDAKSMSCPRCGAAYPTSGTNVMMGLRLRPLLIGFIVLTLFSLMLVNCVVRRIPHASQATNMRSPAVLRALTMMQYHQQGTQNGTPRPPLR